VEALCPIWILLLAGGGLLGALLVGLVVLVKLGVLANYATRTEEPDRGDYSLDDSREVNE
jgi:hypothetical protein